MRKLTWHAAVLLTMTTLLASCADSSSEPATATVKPSDAGPTTAEPTTAGPTTSDDDRVLVPSTEADERANLPEVAAAISDLAERDGIDIDDVTITSLEQVTWRDGSSGCPQKGMQYSQALVPGQQLILSRASEPDQSFAYHAGSRGVFSYCESPQPPLDGAPGST